MADKIDFGNDDFDAANGAGGGEHEPPGISADYSTAHNGWQPPPGLNGADWPPPPLDTLGSKPGGVGDGVIATGGGDWEPPGATGDVSALGGAPSGVLGTLRGVWPPDGVSLLGGDPRFGSTGSGAMGGANGGDAYLLFIQHGPAGEAGAGITDAIDTSVAAESAMLAPATELPETQLLPGAVYPPW